MIPDAEREQVVKERVSGLLVDAPEPDPLKLAAGLEAARYRRRRQQGRRAIAWLAVAGLFVAGTATAFWFAESEREESPPGGSAQSDGRDEAATEERSGGASPESSAPVDGKSRSPESPVIYRRSN